MEDIVLLLVKKIILLKFYNLKHFICDFENWQVCKNGIY